MRGVRYSLLVTALIITASISAVADETVVEEAVPGNPDRWSSFLPLMAEEAYERGHELPLPFGVGINFITLKRGIEVKEIKVSRNGNDLDVTDVIDVDAATYVDTLMARVDAWILPFLNVYFMGGWLDNDSEVDVTFTVPTFPPGSGTTNVNVQSGGNLTGSVWGGGLQLAAGYGDFFLMLDGNFIYSELDSLLDEVIQVAIYSARTGWNGKISGVPMRVWIGGMYWDADRTVKGTIGDLSFEVLQGPTEPTNLTLGTNVELSKEWSLFVEYAFNFEDLRMLALGTGYRF
jgi:hypothetical protein